MTLLEHSLYKALPTSLLHDEVTFATTTTPRCSTQKPRYAKDAIDFPRIFDGELLSDVLCCANSLVALANPTPAL